MWCRAPEGLSIPYVRNMMLSDACEFMCQCIHFADNDQRPIPGNQNYDPLYKICYAMEAIIKGICKIWDAGKRITID